MQDLENLQIPSAVTNILVETEAIGFAMVSEPLVGSLLRSLAASKPGGAFLEMGTGTGISTAWLLSGMSPTATLVSVENDPTLMAIAQTHLATDPRLSLKLTDGGTFLEQLSSTDRFDLIFADTWAGKYTHLDLALQTLNPGGFYIIDDMLPQPNWPEGHNLKATALIAELEQRQDFSLTKMSWGSGVILATKQIC
jgi:predicted O-methyltransferase YrrM